MSLTVIPGPRTAQWAALRAHAQRLEATPVRELFARDPGRYEHCSRERAGLLLDFSRQRLDRGCTRLFARACRCGGLARAHRCHVARRGHQSDRGACRAARGAAPAARRRGGWRRHREAGARRACAHAGVRRGRARWDDPRQRRAALHAGREHRHRRLGPGSRHGGAGAARLHERVRRAASSCPTSTAATSPRCWSRRMPARRSSSSPPRPSRRSRRAPMRSPRAPGSRGSWVDAAVPAHFAAVSVNTKAMDEFGVHPEYRFAMWDWVGGRYSIWSSIGVSLAIAIGRGNFLDFLGGGYEMDEHFRSAPWAENLPALMGLIGVWNINFMKLPTLAVLPYDDSLRRFPAYLQQLEMESNGKSVMLDGAPVECETAAVIWGEPGNNAQHSFFQLLHQGTPRAALDFLLPARSSCGNQPQQNLAIASCLAQAEAFTAGQTAADRARRARGARAAGGADRGAHSSQGPSGQPPEHHRALPETRSRDPRQADRALRAQRVSRRASCGGSTPSTSGAWSSARSSPSNLCRR